MMVFDETVVDETGVEVCLPCSPGARNANDIMAGDSSAVVREFVYVAERSLLIGLGLYAAGFRAERLVRGTFAATMAMEAFVLGYVLVKRATQL